MTYMIKELEDTIDIVSDWAVEAVQVVLKVISPDGRPFGYEEETDEDQIIQYLQYKSSPESWAERVGELTGELMQKLRDNGLSEDQIISIHPIDIVQKYLIAYSVEMEEKMEKNSAEVPAVS